MKRRARRCLGVDIGSTSIKVAELSQDRTGVIIQRLVEAPLDVTPETPADSRWAAVVQTLRDVLRANRISTRQAAFALPGHAVFVRRVRLPRTTEERLERIIRFEARQQIPFPLEQTLLQYQISSTDMPDEVEVLLVAIKREIVDNYMSLVRRLGLRPIRLGVSSFALFNFHMFDAGVEPEQFSLDELTPAKVEASAPPLEPGGPAEVEKPAPRPGLMAGLRGLMSRKKKPAVEQAPTVAADDEMAEAERRALVPVASTAEEIKAYVNIGASTIDLAIGRAGGARIIGFARSIPVAGHQLTRVIQERCGFESFEQAERIKREQTQVVSGGAPVPADRCHEQACRSIMPVVDRMVAEIRRSLDFYISQPDGVAVDRLVLSGGQMALPNLAGYMEERLGIPVEIARDLHNPLCRLNVRDGPLTNFLSSIGLALQGLGQGCIAIDFLPEQMKGWIEFKRKNLQLALQAAILAAILAVGAQIGNRMAGLWNQTASDMQRQIVDVGPTKERLENALQRQQKALFTMILLERAAGMSEEFGLDRDYFFKVLTFIQAVRPADIFFGDLTLGPNGELMIEGYAEQQRSAAMLVQALSGWSEVEKAALTRLPVLVRDPFGSGRALYNFQLTARIKGKLSKIVPAPTPEGWRGGADWRMLRTPPPAPGGTPGPGGGRPADYES